MSLFRAEGLVKRFGGLLATDHVDLAVEAGEIHALIGPNGAGKSTLVNLISGLLPADAGRIVLDGVDLTALAPHERTRAGLARCFQITSVFRNDSVRDNLLLAVQAQAGSSFRCLSRRDAEHALQERAEALAQLRLQRNRDLQESDAWALKALEELLPPELRTYRQALRDLPSTTTDPVNGVEWPTKPAVL